MITRVFRGRARPGMEAVFERAVRDDAIPRFWYHPGIVDLHFGTPTDDSPGAFLVVTVWRDLAALRDFAGPRWSDVVMSALERDALEEASVDHYRDATAESRDHLAALRRFAGPAPAVRGASGGSFIDLGSILVDLSTRRAHVDGAPVPLPPLEFALLVELASRPGVPIPSAELARRLWPGSLLSTGDDVRRSVYRLRRLLGDHWRTPPLIWNRRGLGYVLEP